MQTVRVTLQVRDADNRVRIVQTRDVRIDEIEECATSLAAPIQRAFHHVLALRGKKA